MAFNASSTLIPGLFSSIPSNPACLASLNLSTKESEPGFTILTFSVFNSLRGGAVWSTSSAVEFRVRTLPIAAVAPAAAKKVLRVGILKLFMMSSRVQVPFSS